MSFGMALTRTTVTSEKSNSEWLMSYEFFISVKEGTHQTQVSSAQVRLTEGKYIRGSILYEEQIERALSTCTDSTPLDINQWTSKVQNTWSLEQIDELTR